MHRTLYACTLAASLVGAPVLASAPAAAPPSATPRAAPAPVPADTPVDASRVAEARALIPPPLLYGGFRPEVGTFVEYAVTSPKEKTLVRAAVVGRTERPDGDVLYQVEFDYHASKPRALVVLWIIARERPFIDRLALSVPPYAPISVPVDLYADQPELRGTPVQEADAEVKKGPFAGKARKRTFRQASGATAEVVTSAQVPLFGVETVRSEGSTWVAQQTGTGAKPELSTVPIAVPRMPLP